MSDDKDVLGKADALLRRHAGGPAPEDPAELPVLTDFVEPLPAAAPEAPAPGRPELARDLFQRVMAEAESRLASDLERRLAQQLAPQVRAAAAAAIAELRRDLADAVAEAVKQALERRDVK